MTQISGIPGGPATGATTSVYTSNANGSPSTKGDLGKDAFLNLLVAQLKYQDPSSPMDSSQFMAQTAQMTMVEKMEELAKSTSSQLQNTQLQAATSMVGRSVSWTTADGTTQTGNVSAVTLTGGSPKLVVGNFEVDLGSVTKVAAATTPAPAPTTPKA